MEVILRGQLYKKFPWLNLVQCYCGNGWFGLLLDLCEELELCYKKNNRDISTICVNNIAEKYGTLSFDASNCSDEDYEIIKRYEEKSSVVCEKCGEQGRLCAKDNWLKTLCSKCSREMGYRVVKNAGS